METIARDLLTFLLNSLWQAPLAAGVAALACRLMRNGPARHRHAVCAAALITALLLPAASMRQWTARAPTNAVPIATQRAAVPAAPISSNPAGATAAPPPAHRTIPFPRTAAAAVLLAYLAFLLYRLVRLARAAARTAAICRTAAPGVHPAWARCLDAFGLGGVELRWSRRIPGPVTAGRVILLPAEMADAPEELLATALGHEMAHLARHDFALNMLYELIYLPISFHPAAAWLHREIGRTRELACDELVTSRLLEPAVYARSIMTIAAGISAAAQPEYSLGVCDGDILEERIERLLHRPLPNLKRARLLLAAGLSSLAACVVIASGLAISARAQTPAQQELKAGADAFNQGDFHSAVEHFEQAVTLEPGNANTRLHFANALVRESTTEMAGGPVERENLLKRAKQQYRDILDRDPKNVAALVGLVSLNGPTHAAESRTLILQAIAADPSNGDAYYTAGVADWEIVYAPIKAAQQAAGIFPEVAFIPDATVRKQLRDRFLPNIEEAFRMLQIALDKDPRSERPMAYLNLVARAKAAIAETPEESGTLIAQADDWVGKALAQIRANGGRKQDAARVDAASAPPLSVPAIPAPPPPPPRDPAHPPNPREVGQRPAAPPK